MSISIQAESALALPGPSQSLRALASKVKEYSSFLSTSMVDPSGRATDSFHSMTEEKKLEVAAKMLEMAAETQKFLDTDQEVQDWTRPSSFRQQVTNTTQHAGGAIRSFVLDYLGPIGALSYLPAPKNLSFLITSGQGSPSLQKGIAIMKSVSALKNLVAVLSMVPQNKDLESYHKNKTDPVVDKFIASVPHLAASIQNSIASSGVFSRRASAQADRLLAGHPESTSNVLSAAGYFTYDKSPVVEQPGESSQAVEPASPQSQYSLTGSDILGLATYAASIVDPRVAAGKGAVSGAILDAVLRAIAEKDGGIYAGKISSSTMDLIIDHAAKLAGGKKMQKPENQNSRYKGLAAKGGKDDPSSEIPDAEVSSYVDPSSIPKMASKVTKPQVEPVAPATSVLDTLMGLGADVAGKSQGAAKAQVKKTVQKLPANVRTKLALDLDRVANALQDGGLTHLAETLDIVSNTVEEATSEEDSY